MVIRAMARFFFFFNDYQLMQLFYGKLLVLFQNVYRVDKICTIMYYDSLASEIILRRKVVVETLTKTGRQVRDGHPSS